MFCWASAEEENAAPALTESVSSENYQLYRLLVGVNIGRYKQSEGNYFVNISELFERAEEPIPRPVSEYLQSLSELPEEAFNFESAIKREYYYSTKWTDKNHIITVKHFKKTGSESDLTPYLGPIASIPTQWEGIATYQLDFDGDHLMFRSYAERQIFSLRKNYWVYLDVYFPDSEFRDQVKMLVLVANDPNKNLDDNGVYILIPKDG